MEPDEGAGGGGFMSQKWFGIPAPVVIIGVALVAYFLFFRNASSGGGTSTAGTGDTLSQGDTTISSGAVQVSVNAGGSGDTSTSDGNDTDSDSDDDKNPTPHPPKHRRMTTVTVPRVIGETAPRARRVIERRGLKARGISGGIVAGERPKAGTKVKRGSTVDLTGRGKNK